jgi:hypothetical protein
MQRRATPALAARSQAGARQIQILFGLRPVTNQDDVGSTKLRAARYKRIGRQFEPDRFESDVARGLVENISYSPNAPNVQVASPRRARRKPLKPLRGECRVFPV